MEWVILCQAVLLITVCVFYWKSVNELRRNAASLADYARYWHGEADRLRNKLTQKISDQDEKEGQWKASRFALEATIEELRSRKLIPEEIETLAVAAKPLMEDIERRDPSHSGENKRHRVFAQLQKDLPEVPHWKLALAIEWAYKVWFVKE